MLRLVSIFHFTFCISTCLAQSQAPPPIATPIRVECHGKLRHGVVAVGGETTGTTITFNSIVWELKLADDASRTFANEHQKKAVTVKGTLRRVVATAVPVRWIVDVERLVEREARVQNDGSSIRITGMIRPGNVTAGESPGKVIETDGVVWPLDFSKVVENEARAESLNGKQVDVTGQVKAGSETKSPKQLLIKVEKIDASSNPPK